MRIISGKFGGRQFDSPGGNRTHPMADKIRGAIFNALGNIDGLTVLDAFAGSGALGFEALSRGAAHVTAIDIDKSAIITVVNSAHALDITRQIKVIRAGITGWLETSSNQLFDLVFCDPPYDKPQLATVSAVARRVQSGGILVLSLPPTETVPDFEDFELLKEKSYGDAVLRFYRRS